MIKYLDRNCRSEYLLKYLHYDVLFRAVDDDPSILTYLGTAIRHSCLLVSEPILIMAARSHMINIVNIGGKRYMVDVGFGANGATHPMPLEDGTLSTNISPANVRLLWKNIDENEDKEQKLWVFQHQNDEQSEWRDMYCFTQLEFLPQDYKVMNYFTSTNRACFFTYKVVCTKMILEGDELVGNLILQNDMKRRLHGKTEHIETFENEGQRLAALRKWFGIVFTRDEVDGIKGMVSELRANGPGM